MDEYLRIFEVPDGNVNLKTLSMGQKKKVFLCFALAANTRILIMDEPTNGLDIMSKSQFRKVIAKSVTDDKVLLLSTHQVRDVDTLLDHVLIVDHSQVLLNASIGEIGRRLAFKMTNDVTDAIYWQPTLGGNVVVKPNVDGEETVVEIESLYNAVMCNPAMIKQLFEGK
jgi:ABC-2 type transport system ATP-binding protein